MRNICDARLLAKTHSAVLLGPLQLSCPASKQLYGRCPVESLVFWNHWWPHDASHENQPRSSCVPLASSLTDREAERAPSCSLLSFASTVFIMFHCRPCLHNFGYRELSRAERMLGLRLAVGEWLREVGRSVRTERSGVSGKVRKVMNFGALIPSIISL